MKNIALLSIPGLFCVLLVGCGGGTNSVAPGGQSASGTGRAVFTVVWPLPSRLVPAASSSVRVNILNGSQAVTSKVLPRPDSGNQTTATFDALPPGNLTVLAAAYPQADGGGIAQAQASAPLVIQANQTSTITLTMGSTIDHLEATPSSLSLQTGETRQIAVTAYDALHQVVLISASKVDWKSDIPNVAAVNSSGLVQGGVQGTAQITITELEANKNVKLTATVTASGGGGGGGGGGTADPWPQNYHDYRHASIGIGQGGTSKLKWANNMFAASSVVLSANGTLYAGGTDTSGTVIQDYFAAMNGQTGRILWKKTLAGAGNVRIPDPALGTNGQVYVGHHNVFYALDQATGNELWTHDFSNDVPGDLTVGPDNTLYLSVYSSIRASSKIYALDGASGATKWTFVGAVRGTALAADGTVYAGSDASSLYALSGQDGTRKWTYTAGDIGVSTPSIGTDGTLYFSCTDQKIYAVNAATHLKKWDFPSGTQWLYPPAIGSDGTVYFTSLDQYVYALDGVTGAQKWKSMMGTYLSDTVSIDGAGRLYVTYQISNKNYLSALDSQNGSPLWTYTMSPNANILGSPEPIIGPDGTIYTTDRATSLLAIQ